MRLFFFMALISSTVFAGCPDLSGKYAQCLSLTGNTPGSKDVTLTQRTENGIEIYTMASSTMEGKKIVDDMISDGDFYTQIQLEPATGTQLTITKQYTCDGDALKVAMSVIFGEEIMMDTILLMKKQEDGSMTMKMEGTGSNGKPIAETIHCR